MLRRLLLIKIRLFKKSVNFWVLVGVLLVLCSLVSRSLTELTIYSRVSHIQRMKKHEKSEESKMTSRRTITSRKDAPFQYGCQAPPTSPERANAALVVLARNSEIGSVLESMDSLERHFNQWFHYPWVFLNDEPFDDKFKTAVMAHTKSEVEFGTIPPEDWEFSDKFDKQEINENIQTQGDRGILYGRMESYHKMCRFYSGRFYKHELIQKRDWYWRVEPDVQFYCDLTYDPFLEMEKHNKKYGFNVMIEELYYTAPGLFRETKAFVKQNKVKVKSAWELFVDNHHVVKGANQRHYRGFSNDNDILRKIEEDLNVRKFLSYKDKKDHDLADLNPDLILEIMQRSTNKPPLLDDRIDEEEYNMCHFWTNFEIARTDLFNSETYDAYFNHLDDSGGFFKERWGDAPVHSLAVGMLLDLDEIHYFRDIGYKHSVLAHCPANSKKNQLKYEPGDLPEANGLASSGKSDKPKSYGVGCRCRCPKRELETEDTHTKCIKRWISLTKDRRKPRKLLDLDHWEEEIDRRISEYLDNGGRIGDSTIAENLAENPPE